MPAASLCFLVLQKQRTNRPLASLPKPAICCPRQLPEQAVAKSITSRITSFVIIIIIPDQVREFFHARRLERSTTQVERQIQARWRV